MNDIMLNLKGNKTTFTPIWLMRQAGRYMKEYNEIKKSFKSFMSMCHNKEAISNITLQPVEKFDLDAGIIFSDILVLLECMGMKVDFIQGIGPRIEYNNIEEVVKNLSNTYSLDKLNSTYEAIGLVSKELKNKNKPLIGFSGAPWTLACYAVEKNISKDLFTIRRFSIEKPRLMEKLLDYLSEIIILHLSNQIKNGASAVQIFDTHANFLDHYYYKRFSIEKLKYITKNLKKLHPDTPIIIFSKGKISDNNSYYENIDGLSFSSHYEMHKYIKKIPSRICFQGNLDPMILLVGGSYMKERVYNILNSMKEKNFIFNLGHGIQKETPVENVTELVNIVKTFKK